MTSEEAGVLQIHRVLTNKAMLYQFPSECKLFQFQIALRFC